MRRRISRLCTNHECRGVRWGRAIHLPHRKTSVQSRRCHSHRDSRLVRTHKHLYGLLHARTPVFPVVLGGGLVHLGHRQHRRATKVDRRGHSHRHCRPRETACALPDTGHPAVPGVPRHPTRSKGPEGDDRKQRPRCRRLSAHQVHRRLSACWHRRRDAIRHHVRVDIRVGLVRPR